MMGSKRLKGSFFDNDILKAIEDISFISESYTKCEEVKKELEIEVLNLTGIINELKKSEQELIEAHASLKKLIAEQQFTISKLVTVKDEIKEYKEEVYKRYESVKQLKEEIFRLTSNYEKEKSAALNSQNLKQEEIVKEYEQTIQKLTDELDTRISEAVCNCRELNEELLRIKTEKEEQSNFLVLGYEEQLQKVYAQNVRMRDEMQDFRKRTNANISVYQKRIEELEQMQQHRKNVVPLNSIRSDPCTPATKLMNPTENRQSRIKAMSNVKKDDNNALNHTASIKLAHKQNNVQRAYTPLQIQITPCGSSIVQVNQKSRSPVPVGSVLKGSKRKLFTKNNDEFKDFEEEEE